MKMVPSQQINEIYNSWQLKYLMLQKTLFFAPAIFYEIFLKIEQNILIKDTQLNLTYHQFKQFTMEYKVYPIQVAGYETCCQLNIKRLNPNQSLKPKLKVGIRIYVLAEYSKTKSAMYVIYIYIYIYIYIIYFIISFYINVASKLRAREDTILYISGFQFQFFLF